MGLDTSHGCWSGPYSSFNRYRRALCQCAGLGDLDAYIGFNGDKPFPKHDLVPLLDHSDCDGEIPWKQCGLLALELLKAQPAMETAGWGAENLRWISGLNDAFNRKENIEFH